MPSFVRMSLQVGEDANTLDKKLLLASNKPQQGLQNVGAWISGLAGNANHGANMKIVKDAVRASSFGTFTGDPTAAQALTVNGVTFTARASGAVANEFNIDTGANGVALADAINASVTAKIKNIIKAVGVLQVCTITCLVPGTIGNLCTLTENLDNFTVDNATLEGGTEDTDVELAVGLPAETSA